MRNGRCCLQMASAAMVQFRIRAPHAIAHAIVSLKTTAAQVYLADADSDRRVGDSKRSTP
jgi:hypothetical protein